jgi:LysR family transcriptional regulator, benzoate and cis,cis-muconate-responsive activator of ben and cat genes
LTAIEVRRLRYLCVLAEQLHVTQAALLLNVVQPDLSHQIKQLEEELGA